VQRAAAGGGGKAAGAAAPAAAPAENGAPAMAGAAAAAAAPAPVPAGPRAPIVVPGAEAMAATDVAGERARAARRRAREATEAASARAAAALPDLGRDEPFVPPSAALKTCGPALRTSWCEARPCMSGQLTAAVLPQKGDDAAVMLAKAYAPNNARVSTHTPSAVHIGASPTAGEPKVCGSRAAGAHRKCAGESTAHAAVPAGMGRMPGKSRAGAQLEG